jgi:hypothetical protein
VEEMPPHLDPSLDPLPLLELKENASGSGSSTAKRAMTMLTTGDLRFREPTKAQRRNLAMAFAGQDKIVYGRAFDAVRIPPDLDIDLDDLAAVEANLHHLTLYEIKSTNRKNLGDDFHGYFFALSTAELLVAQSLGPQFRFLLVHTLSGARLELGLQDLLSRARSIYPSWSVLF